jgi:hypothetical protein
MDRKEYERRQREPGESPHWIKVNTPNALNVNHERAEDWGLARQNYLWEGTKLAWHKMRKKEGPRQRCSNCGEWTNNPDRICDACLVAGPDGRARRRDRRLRRIADSQKRGSVRAVSGGLPSLGKHR